MRARRRHSQLTSLGAALNEMLKTPEQGFDDYFE